MGIFFKSINRKKLTILSFALAGVKKMEKNSGSCKTVGVLSGVRRVTLGIEDIINNFF